MKEKTNSNIPIILLCTGLVFLLLFLTMVIGNWVIIMGIRAGLFSGHPDTPLIPFLIQTGMVSIFIGVILTLALCRIPLAPDQRTDSGDPCCSRRKFSDQNPF